MRARLIMAKTNPSLGRMGGGSRGETCAEPEVAPLSTREEQPDAKSAMIALSF